MHGLVSPTDTTTREGALRSQIFDVGLAIGLLAAGLLQAFDQPAIEGSGYRGADPLYAAALVVMMLPMIWRRRWPIPVAVVSASVFCATIIAGYDGASSASSVQLIAVYSIGVYASRPAADRSRWLMGAAVTVVFYWGHELGHLSFMQVALMLVTWSSAAAFGEMIYARRRYQIALEERARLAESERDERARLAVQDERARIARELHDVWAHTLSLVVVQAGAAQEVLDDSPEQARESLVRIQQAGRQALAEVRRLISSDEGKTGFDRNPAPGMRDIGPLVEQFREAGLPVELTVVGSVQDLPDDVGLSAYRIVQQALTNTLSHGGPRVSATVRIGRTDGRLDIDVVDDGLGAAASADPGHDGRGVIGMRERVAVFGGRFRAGPRDQGGFEVAASIPLGVGG